MADKFRAAFFIGLVANLHCKNQNGVFGPQPKKQMGKQINKRITLNVN
jgi:hypothetical protein